MQRIAIFASGNGTNAQNIIEYFQKKKTASVELVCSNKADAFVLERAVNLNVQPYVFTRQQFYETNHIIDIHGVVA